jgi:hypothetical protein
MFGGHPRVMVLKQKFFELELKNKFVCRHYKAPVVGRVNKRNKLKEHMQKRGAPVSKRNIVNI